MLPRRDLLARRLCFCAISLFFVPLKADMPQCFPKKQTFCVTPAQARTASHARTRKHSGRIKVNHRKKRPSSFVFRLLGYVSAFQPDAKYCAGTNRCFFHSFPEQPTTLWVPSSKREAGSPFHALAAWCSTWRVGFHHGNVVVWSDAGFCKGVEGELSARATQSTRTDVIARP